MQNTIKACYQRYHWGKVVGVVVEWYGKVEGRSAGVVQPDDRAAACECGDNKKGASDRKR